MTKLLEYLGMRPPAPIERPRVTLPERPLDMTAFTKWCQQHNVSCQVNKSNEFTVLIGNHTKYVTLQRL